MFVCLSVFQALRSHEGSEAQVCFFIIQLLLLKPHDLRLRVNAFIREASGGAVKGRVSRLCAWANCRVSPVHSIVLETMENTEAGKGNNVIGV